MRRSVPPRARSRRSRGTWPSSSRPRGCGSTSSRRAASRPRRGTPSRTRRSAWPKRTSARRWAAWSVSTRWPRPRTSCAARPRAACSATRWWSMAAPASSIEPVPTTAGASAMSRSSIPGFRIAGVATCVPPTSVSNLDASLGFDPEEVRKVIAMAGVRERRVVDDGVTASDLCFEAAEQLLQRLGWDRESVSGLIFVTQSPDYFLPSTACMLHQWLGLGDDCAAFDMGLGCSGYPYGLYLAATMLRGGGHKRILMLHGETPSRFVAPDDQATRLLFSDAGSATAIEIGPSDDGGGHFC